MLGTFVQDFLTLGAILAALQGYSWYFDLDKDVHKLVLSHKKVAGGALLGYIVYRRVVWLRHKERKRREVFAHRMRHPDEP